MDPFTNPKSGPQNNALGLYVPPGHPGRPGTALAPGPATRSAPEAAAFDPKIILHIILKRLWLFLAIVAIGPTVTWLYVRKLPPEYQTAASLVVDNSTPQVLGSQFRDIVDYESGSWWSTREYLETQFQIIRSRTMALDVASRLCARETTDPKTGAKMPSLQRLFAHIDCGDKKSVERAAPSLQGMITVALGRDSRVVLLTVDGLDAEMVAAVANTYAQTYISRNLQQRLEASGKAAGWLGSEFSSLQEQLTEAEERLARFKAENNIIFANIDDQQVDVMRRRRRYTEELDAVRLKVIALRPAVEQFGHAADREVPTSTAEDDPLSDLPPVLQDSENIQKMKQRLGEAEEKKNELTSKYLDDHPLVQQQERRLQSIRLELRKEIRLATKNIQAEYERLLRQEQDLRKSVEDANREARDLEGKSIRYNQLRRDYERLRRPTEAVGGRETESELAARLPNNNVRLLDAALPPGAPIGPNRRLAVFTALVVALIMGIALAFLLEVLDATVKTQDDMERVLQIPYLGMIPHMPDTPGDEGPKDLFIARHPKSTVAECCRVIRTNLLFMSPDKPARTLLVTSAGPQEGKSMSSISLALSMAQSGSRVLLVDTDMRRPRLHKVFKVPSGSPGLTSVIAGTVTALEAVRTTSVENLFLLTCGPMPPNPAELLQTERFRHIVQELAQAFDKVVFDSPPIGAVTDALVLSQVTDGVVLVAKSHKTSRDMLRRAERQLRDLSATMFGAVLNDLDLESRRKGYGYPYYYYYKSGSYRYGYYTADNDKDAETAIGDGPGPTPELTIEESP